MPWTQGVGRSNRPAPTNIRSRNRVAIVRARGEPSYKTMPDIPGFVMPGIQREFEKAILPIRPDDQSYRGLML